MKKAKKTVRKKKVSANPNLEELQAMVEKAVLAAQEKAKQPVVDPSVKANADRYKASMRKYMARQRDKTKERQASCLHLQGCSLTSDSPGKLTSIIWHQFPAQSYYTGICQNCLRKFTPDDDDYDLWVGKISGSIPSTSGGVSPWEIVRTPRYWAEQQTRLPEEWRAGMDGQIYAGDELDKLPDYEIRRLYKSTLELVKELKPVLDIPAVMGRKKPKGIVNWE